MSEVDKAQSETVGVILLTAVIVVLAGGFGVFYLGAVDDRASDHGPLIDVNVDATGAWVSLTHTGGESIPTDQLDVLVHVNGTNDRLPFDDMESSEDDNDAFDPGDSYRNVHALGSGQMEVLLIHTGANTVVHHEYLDAPVDDGTTASFTVDPTDPARGETAVFDANASTGIDGVQRYEWDLNEVAL